MSEQTTKIFTWNDLQVAIASMSEEQKAKQALVRIEDSHVLRRLAALEFVQEDVYVNKSDNDDCGGLKDLEDLHGDDFDLANYELNTTAGTPFLWDEF